MAPSVDSKPNVLFLCTGNSCRSQMAEGWVKDMYKGKVDAFSAGVKTNGLNPYAVKVMSDAGVDISDQKSQLIDDFKDQPLDLIVTVCDHAASCCPDTKKYFGGHAKVIHSPFDDPPAITNDMEEDEKIRVYSRVRDEIKLFVASLPIPVGEH